MPLMALGSGFVFEVGQAVYDEFKRKTVARLPTVERIRNSLAVQNMGPGENTATITGIVWPLEEAEGTIVDIARMRSMVGGAPQVLVTGYGEVIGRYIVKSFEETHSYIERDGAPIKIAFTMELLEYTSAVDQVSAFGAIGNLGNAAALLRIGIGAVGASFNIGNLFGGFR